MTQQPDGELPVIEFVAPLPGFPRHRAFALVRLDEDGLLYALTSVDDPGLRFLVAPPAPFFPAYAPEVPEEALELLGTDDLARILLLLVITTGESVAESTANQLAPILIDQVSRKALQVVLSGSDLPVRAELTAAA
ncbi:hypothetical protein GCM10010124_08600 [Pilimelia terevasa]|uniref:Flagellar assembly factor FliW n=1 Tax=Pilimelia terevasa TaxID=53372 RepID=A0A8J3FFI8_9ACTN|nr:flagellar assembly protein FliW [Pilimelia terevasa]GGK18301.1 hypothetical protein GCM10010124_08600 [Pilimelia terevasa]